MTFKPKFSVKHIFLCFNFVAFSFISSSQNLLLNPSFEEYNKDVFTHTCIFISRDSSNIKNWFSTGNASIATTHKCSSKSMYLSSNKLGLKPVDGKWMIGFTAIRFPKGNNSREYLVGKLSKPCKANTTYQISFFLSPRNGCDKGAGALGIWLTNGVTSSGNFNSNFSIKPQLTFTTEDLTQKGVWQKFELEFIASGNEVYFVIGNFNNDAETVAVQLSGNTKKVEYWENYYSAFYFIDAVSVIEVPTKTPSTLFQK